MAELSRDEAREMRETGRRAMEQVARVAREAASQAGMSRTFARVSKVNADGTLQLELGSDLHPMPLYSVRMTTACAAAQPGDTVVVDTYAHVPLATGVIRTAGSAAHLVPQHSQDASTVTGTLGVSHGGTGATTAAGARSSLGVEQSPLLVNGRFHGTGSKYFLIAKSSLPTNDNACAGYVRVRADFGGWTAPTRTTVDVTVHLRQLDVSVAQCVLPESRDSLLQVKLDPSGYVWVYLWMSEEYYYASVRVDGEQFERLGTWGGEPSGDIKWTSNMFQSYPWRKRLYAGAMVGSGLKFNDGTLSVDNGVYANNGPAASALFWSSGDTVADLDKANLGVCHYGTNTNHRPNDYGCCLTMRCGNGGQSSEWVFQLALPTLGDPKWRRNINGAGWSSWWTWTTS